MADIMKFALDLKEQEIEIGNKPYKIKELTALEVGKWKDEQAKKVKLDAQNRPMGIKSHVGLESGLISLCLFDEQDRKVPIDVINTWPSSLVIPLFKACFELNGLNSEADDNSKNS